MKLKRLQNELKWLEEMLDNTTDELAEDALIDVIYNKEEELIEEGKRILMAESKEAYEALCELVESIRYREKAIKGLMKLSA